MAQTLNHNKNIVQITPLNLPTCDVDVDNIQQLDDEPNDVGGLSAAELKAIFDETGKDLKDYLNDDLIPAVIAADATEQARAQAEAERVANEIERVANETARELAETSRASAETDRATAETARNTAEGLRASAETERATAESLRVNAETLRVNAETARGLAETARGTSETNRANAEGTRVSNETTRVSNETDRGTAESGRVNAESGRVSAETGRVSAENARVSAETARNLFENFNSTKAYLVGNKVAYQGSSYYCIANTTAGILPTNTTYWLLIAQKGQDGTGSGDMSQSDYDRNQTVKNAGGIPTYVGMQVQDKSDKSVVLTGTLDADDWSSNTQTLTISGLATSGYWYIISPNASDFLKWAKSTIYADDITTSNSITFHCKTVPTDNISVTIVKIQEG